MEDLKQSSGEINYQQLAILLTVLDKEAHNTLYFKRMVPAEEQDKLDNEYFGEIRRIQSLFASQISEENVEGFCERNPHLKGLFVEITSLASLDV